MNKAYWAVRSVRLILLWLTVAWAATGFAAPITVDAGRQHPLVLKKPIRQIAIGNPEIADVQMATTGEILITALRPGETNLHVWFRGQSTPEEFTVVVNPETGLRSDIESAGLSLTTAGDRVRLRGDAGALAAHDQALALATRDGVPPIDASRLHVPAEVQTDIKVVEISRQKLRSAGVFLGKNTANTTAVVSPPGVLSGVESAARGFQLNSAAGFLPSAQAFNLVVGDSTRGLLSVFSLLESKGFAYTLAEPSLVTMSGQTASFLVGGEFPIPVMQGSGTSASVTIEYKEFGVRVTLAPTVLAQDRIMLKVAPEVSELDFSAGVQSGGVAVPALRVRRADTSVELGNGESFVIAGLISQDTIADVDKLPGLGDLPVLGALFRNSRIQKDDRELVMIVTPHLVSPLARDSQLPPLPGERYRTYDPDFAHQLFGETGDFKPSSPHRTGFSD